MPDAPELSDEELVRRARAGDGAAAAVLFDRHVPLLRARARSRLPAMLRPKVGASDVVQEAWLAAFLSLGEFEDRGDGSFGRWLRQILEHKILDEVERGDAGKRDPRREVPLPEGDEGAAPAADQTSPSVQIVAAEETAEVRAAVDELPSDWQTVIRLLHREGLTVAQAAERMGRSPAAVGKLHARAIGRLSAKLAR
jgi:RNA polymerase sigma-70 factor (ECF subfamily)